MNRLILRLTAAVVLWHFLIVPCEAQLVQVGPGFVKAPFVRVYWGPDGSSYVRAPFVSVFSPGYRPHGWVGSRRLPTYQNPAQMDSPQLSATIGQLAAQLDAELANYPDGDKWKAELKTAEIRAISQSNAQTNDGPTADQRVQILSILRAFHDTRNAGLSDVSGLRSFQALEAALVEYAAPPNERVRRQMTVASAELNRALARISTGAGWQKYLALPTDVAQSPPANSPQAEESSFKPLADVLQRFDSVSRDERYRMIAQMPAFRSTHQRLAAYVALADELPPGSESQVEELPAPAPGK